MTVKIDDADKPLIRALFRGDCDLTEQKIIQTLERVSTQKNTEADANWKQVALYIVLFIFLYSVLGASLTLDLSSGDSGHRSIDYAMEAVPVLIAFSGYFVSVLFVFFCRSSARRQANWRRLLVTLEKYHAPSLFEMAETQGASTTNYSVSSINTALALFICLTWIVMYNFFTFTTSGVIGSVISLFITTMTYVILDIQLLKPGQIKQEPPKDGDEDTSE